MRRTTPVEPVEPIEPIEPAPLFRLQSMGHRAGDNPKT